MSVSMSASVNGILICARIEFGKWTGVGECVRVGEGRGEREERGLPAKSHA